MAVLKQLRQMKAGNLRMALSVMQKFTTAKRLMPGQKKRVGQQETLMMRIGRQ